jgi:NodT family efflux transporter outer membrane factor (OMF) lipoprotein
MRRVCGQDAAVWRVIGTGALLLGVSCTAGRNFAKPPPPAGGGFTASPLSTTATTPNVAGGEAQRFVAGLDIPGQWWTTFHSKALSDLVERALRRNPDVNAAQAALVAAEEHLLAQRGAYFPAISAGLSAAREKTSAALSPTPNSGALYFSLFTPDVSVSFVPDVFGLNRRTVESLRAQAEAERFALAATHITLSANVVVAAIEQASLRAQIGATYEMIAYDSDAVAMLRKQVGAGYASQLDLAAQVSQLAQVAAGLPPLLKALAIENDLIARLMGAFPNASVDTFDLSQFSLPDSLPVSLPSQFVEQRPDVLQAEENLQAASAEVGVAAANRLPTFALTAGAGTMALAASQILGAGVGFWALAASVTQPVLQGGTLRHEQRAAEAAYTEAFAEYQGTVLSAFQNVADALRALEQDAAALAAAATAEEAARITRDAARSQVSLGYAGSLALLSAESAYEAAVIALVQARTNRFLDTVALFQALGGGWWHRTDLPQHLGQVLPDSEGAAAWRP